MVRNRNDSKFTWNSCNAEFCQFYSSLITTRIAALLKHSNAAYEFQYICGGALIKEDTVVTGKSKFNQH